MKNNLILLTLTLTLISCQPKDGPVEILPGPQVDPLMSHVGTWSTGCITSSDNSSKIIHNLVISDNPKTISLTVKVYPINSPDCTSGQLSEFDSSATYSRSGDSYTTSLTSYGYTPKDAGILNILNSSNFCGFTDWVVSQRKDILSKDCILLSEGPRQVDYTRQNGESNEFNVSRNGSVLETDEYPAYDYNLVQ